MNNTQRMTKAKDLLPIEKELVQKAMEACDDAYAPYSKFYVGAAVLLESGIIIKGHNVENAAYPMCLCAERTALAVCSVNHSKDKPVAIAVHAKNDDGLVDDLISPCGACRQVISETEARYGSKIKVIYPTSLDNYTILDSISTIIPDSFSGKTLP